MVRKIRAKLILQLRADGLSGRAIAAWQGMSRKSITAVLDAAEAAGAGWDEVAELEDDLVYAKLFPGEGERDGPGQKASAGPSTPSRTRRWSAAPKT